jgi:hypothetical protein
MEEDNDRMIVVFAGTTLDAGMHRGVLAPQKCWYQTLTRRGLLKL